MALEGKAREYATRLHAGQLRATGERYITHPAAVVQLLKRIGIHHDDILCAAWLHDTIEDCGVTAQDLEGQFNANIARIVQQLTRDCGREEYNSRIAHADYAVQIVKLADTVHNCETLTPGIPGLPEMVQHKLEWCGKVYLPMARRICPMLHEMLEREVRRIKGIMPPSPC